jgi:eukaryotic-like serine/threonine-protein kinase
MTGLAPGTRLGSFQIAALVGAGGMGEVYRARDTKLDRDVAIKVIPSALAADPGRLARFEREAKVLASLSHPHIAQVFGLEEADGIHALVMELVEGEDLSLRIGRGPIAFNEAVIIARQIADALDAAHEKGIVHRDLKPANVMITHDGVVKVLDFGLAKPAAGEAGTDSLTHSPTLVAVAGTREGVLLGTAAYMSPEQARGRVVDKRTDIWAFGCLVFEMLAGRPAFGGDTLSDTIAAIIEREPDWSAFPKTTAPAVKRLIERCLQKDHKRRLRDIGDARVELDDARVADGIAPPVLTTRAWSTLAPVIGVAALAALAGIGGTWLAMRASVSIVRPVRLSVVAPPGTTFTQRDITEHPQFALSPQGDRLALVAGAPGERPRIWIRSFESGVAQPVAGTEGAYGPFWAPNGRSLGFQAEGKLRTVSLDGAAPQSLADLPFDVSHGAWNADGVILFSAGNGSSLSSVRATGGPITPISMLDASRNETAHRWPQFLPDGRFIFFVASTTPDNVGVYLGSLESRSTKQLLRIPTNAAFAGGYLFFEQNGVVARQGFDVASGTLVGAPEPVGDPIVGLRGPSYLPLSAAGNGTLAFWTAALTPSELVWVDRSGRSLKTVGTGARFDSPSLSPDGTRVLATLRTTSNDNEMWLFDAGSGSASSRLTFTRGVARFGIWGPTGEEVVYSMGTQEGPQIFRRPASGAGEEVRIGGIDRHYAVFPDDWSRNGRWLVYVVASQRGFDVWSLDITQQKTESLLQSVANEVQPRLSPNGRFLAYASDESGTWEVYVRGFGGTQGRWLISRGGGTQPVWRNDGRELFYVSLNGVLNVVAVDERTLAPATPQPLFQTTLPNVLAPFRTAYAVAPDGQRFLLNLLRPNSQASAITIALNAVPR